MPRNNQNDERNNDHPRDCCKELEHVSPFSRAQEPARECREYAGSKWRSHAHQTHGAAAAEDAAEAAVAPLTLDVSDPADGPSEARAELEVGAPQDAEHADRPSDASRADYDPERTDRPSDASHANLVDVRSLAGGDATGLNSVSSARGSSSE